MLLITAITSHPRPFLAFPQQDNFTHSPYRPLPIFKRGSIGVQKLSFRHTIGHILKAKT